MYDMSYVFHEQVADIITGNKGNVTDSQFFGIRVGNGMFAEWNLEDTDLLGHDLWANFEHNLKLFGYSARCLDYSLSK